MTLDELRAELDRGPLIPSGERRIDVRAADDQLARRMHAIASRRATGVRVQLPVSSMPVLP